MAADYKRRHIGWGRICAPYVCLCVWHILNVAILANPQADLASHCNIRDDLPNKANDHNSPKTHASLTNDYEAVNQSNLPLDGDVTADIQLTARVGVRINMLDWFWTQNEHWGKTSGNDKPKGAANYFGWMMLLLVAVRLSDDMQLSMVEWIGHGCCLESRSTVIKRCGEVWPAKWLRKTFRQIIVLWALTSVIRHQQIDCTHMPLMQFCNCMQKIRFKRTKQTPDIFQHFPKCDTLLWHSSRPIKLMQKSTLGDGNCWWRAIAPGQAKQWYTLKRNILNYADGNMDLDEQQRASLKAMRKPNAWADQLAVHATAQCLGRTIIVVSGQQFLMIKPHAENARHARPIIVGRHANHFCFVHRQQAKQILVQCMHQVPYTFAEYRDIPDANYDVKHVTRQTSRSIPIRRRCTRAHADASVERMFHQITCPTRNVPQDTLPSSTHCMCKEPSFHADGDDAADEEIPLKSHVILVNLCQDWGCRGQDLVQVGVVMAYLTAVGFCHLLGGATCSSQSQNKRKTPCQPDPTKAIKTGPNPAGKDRQMPRSSDDADPGSLAPCDAAGHNQHFQYDFRLLRNQQREQILNSTQAASNAHTNFDEPIYRKFLEQLHAIEHYCFHNLPPCVINGFASITILVAQVVGMLFSTVVITGFSFRPECNPPYFLPKYLEPGKEMRQIYQDEKRHWREGPVDVVGTIRGGASRPLSVLHVLSACIKIIFFSRMCMCTAEQLEPAVAHWSKNWAGTQVFLHRCHLAYSQELVTSGICKEVNFATCKGCLEICCQKLNNRQQLNSTISSMAILHITVLIKFSATLSHWVLQAILDRER